MDPSIALRVQPPQPVNTLGMLREAQALQDMQRRSQLTELELEQAQQGSAAKNAFAKLVTDPNNTDQRGMLRPEVMNTFVGQHPQAGLEIRNKMLEEARARQQMETSAAQEADALSRARERQREHLVKTVAPRMASALGVYGEKLNSDVPLADAVKAGQEAWMKEVEELEKSGELSKQEIERLKGSTFNPYVFRAQLAQRGIGAGSAGSQPKVEDRYEQVGGKWMKYQVRIDPITSRETRITGTQHPQFKLKEPGEGGPAPVEPSVITEEQQKLTGDAFLATLPPATAKTVKAIAEGRVPLTSLSIRAPKGQVSPREAYLQRVAQYDPTFDASVAPARAATRRDFTAGVAARNVTAINTAIGHMGTLHELSDKLANKDVRAWNAVANRIGLELGEDAVTNFEVAKGAVADELMRVFRVVGASQAEAEDWKQKFSRANSPQQLKGAITTGADLLGSRIEALDDQWKRGMGTDKGYPDLLSPKSKSMFKQLGGRLERFGLKDEGDAGGDLPKPKSKAERDALKPGTKYMAPDGSVRTR